jgi:hypothetical protein
MAAEPISDEARAAIIEHRRAMKAQRKWAKAHRAQIDAEWDALTDPLEEARRERIAFVAANRERIDAEWAGIDPGLVEQ